MNNYTEGKGRVGQASKCKASGKTMAGQGTESSARQSGKQRQDDVVSKGKTRQVKAQKGQACYGNFRQKIKINKINKRKIIITVVCSPNFCNPEGSYTPQIKAF